MASIVCGLDLTEIQWSKFKNSYMWNKHYHLRRTKFIVYQLAMIFCILSQALGIVALIDYVDSKNKNLVARLDAQAEVHNNDYIGAASYNMLAGFFVATTFGAAFFFDLFWPERRESHSVRLAWKICAVLSVCLVCASAFTLTIITATHREFTSGVSAERAEYLVDRFHKDGGAPLRYKDNGRALAAVVFIWPGLVFTVSGCILMFLSIDNIEQGPGPKSAHYREASAQRDPEMASAAESEKEYIPAPALAHQHHPTGRRTETESSPYASPAAESSPPTGAMER